MSRKLKGIAAAPGIAVAPLVHFHTDLEYIPMWEVRPDRLDAERDRFGVAIQAVSAKILALRQEMASTLSNHDAKIYDAQLAILHDKTFVADVQSTIGEGVNAEVGLQRTIAKYEQVFESMQDALMRERAADLRDVGRQVLAQLMARDRKVYTSEGQDYIFAADEFLPSDAGILDRANIRGIVTARGGKYSHGAILARSLGIPAVVGVEALMSKVANGTQVILDGENGLLLVGAEEEETEQYQQRRKELESVAKRVFEVRFAPAVTRDGTEVKLMMNMEGVRDLDLMEQDTSAGIGLFRTEFAFMERRSFPSEDEQVAMYQRAIERAGDRVVTFRTLDVGGDKPLGYFRTPEERNPVLGWRGLRIGLDWPDIFYTQIRAILRASATGHARILLPMVTSKREVERCREALDTILNDLRESGEPHDAGIELGIMVEVPALVHILPDVLRLVDFVSVGTNDLVQYLLAVDRDNPRVASMYDPYHPGVLRVLQQIGHVTSKANISASICGEIAGDHYFTPLLLGFGFRELSMAPVFIAPVKLMVRSFDMDECRALTQQALAMESASAIRKLVQGQVRVRWSQFLEAPADEEDGG